MPYISARDARTVVLSHYLRFTQKQSCHPERSLARSAANAVEGPAFLLRFANTAFTFVQKKILPKFQQRYSSGHAGLGLLHTRFGGRPRISDGLCGPTLRVGLSAEKESC
jgi:hypothetical protein